MAKKILCKLPNASTNINGIEFEETDNGMVSKEFVSDKIAEKFATIRGYSVIEETDENAGSKSKSTKAQKTSGSKSDAESGETAAASAESKS